MKKIIVVAIIVSLSLVMSDSECYSEIEAPSVEAALSGGYLFLDEDLGGDDSAFVRIDLGLNVTKNLGFELSLLNTLDSLGEVPEATFYTLSTVLNLFTESDLNPYVVLGAGAGNFNTGSLDNESKFVINGGLGLKYFLDKKFALRLDFRDYMTTGEVTHNVAASVGVMLYFDILAPTAISIPVDEPYAVEEEAVVEYGEIEREVGTEEMVEPAVQAAGAGEVAPEPSVQAEAEGEPTEQPEEAADVPVQEIAPVATAVAVAAAEKTEVIGEPEKPVAPQEIPEDMPEGQIVVIHKGAQLLLHFPEKSHELNSASYNLLVQLLSFIADREISEVIIVCYSFDYTDKQKDSQISEERASTIKTFFIKSGKIPEEKIRIADQDEGALEKFGKAASENQDNLNRAYILVTFE